MINAYTLVSTHTLEPVKYNRNKTMKCTASVVPFPHTHVHTHTYIHTLHAHVTRTHVNVACYIYRHALMINIDERILMNVSSVCHDFKGHNLGPPCTACTNGSTPKGGACKLPRGGSPPTYMSWAPSPDGPWSAPVEVLAAPWDTNLAVVILSNGSAVVGLKSPLATNTLLEVADLSATSRCGSPLLSADVLLF